MKPELEQHLRQRLSESACPRDVIEDMVASGLIQSPKQAWRTLEKWIGRDEYEFGVCIDLGWLTEKGLIRLQPPASSAALEAAVASPAAHPQEPAPSAPQAQASASPDADQAAPSSAPVDPSQASAEASARRP